MKDILNGFTAKIKKFFSKPQSKEEEEKKKRLLIVILILITLIAVGVSIWAVFFRETTPTLAPDYAPQETEQNAEPMGDEDDEKLEQPEGGGAVSLTYSTEVTIDLSDKNASLLFGNPTKSNQDMLVQIVIQDTVIVQSGRLTPGNQVTKLDLFKDADKMLSPGGYEGRFVVFYYNQETAEKAILNTEIPINITVKE